MSINIFFNNFRNIFQENKKYLSNLFSNKTDTKINSNINQTLKDFLYKYSDLDVESLNYFITKYKYLSNSNKYLVIKEYISNLDTLSKESYKILNDICKSYPKLYNIFGTDIFQFLISICDGWKSLIDLICKKLSKKDLDSISFSNMDASTYMILNIISIEDKVLNDIYLITKFLLDIIELSYENLDKISPVYNRIFKSKEFNFIMNIMCFTAEMKLNNKLKDILDYLSKRGLDFKVYNKKSSFFDIIKISDIPKYISSIFKLYKFNRGIFIGDLLLYYSTKKIESYKLKKEWLENKILYLKMISQETTDQDKLENIKNIIEYYENELTKINAKLDEIYDI